LIGVNVMVEYEAYVEYPDIVEPDTSTVVRVVIINNSEYEINAHIVLNGDEQNLIIEAGGEEAVEFTVTVPKSGLTETVTVEIYVDGEIQASGSTVISIRTSKPSITPLIAVGLALIGIGAIAHRRRVESHVKH